MALYLTCCAQELSIRIARGSVDTMPIPDLASGSRSKSGTSKLAGFGPGFGDFAKGQNVRLAVVAEPNAVADATLFDTSHRCGPNVTAMLLPICSQGSQFGRLRLGVSH